MADFTPTASYPDMDFYTTSAIIYLEGLNLYGDWLRKFLKPPVGEKLQKQIGNLDTLRAHIRRTINETKNDNWVTLNLSGYGLQLMKTCLLYLLRDVRNERKSLLKQHAPEAVIEDIDARLNRIEELTTIGIMSKIPPIKDLMGPIDNITGSKEERVLMYDEELNQTVREIRNTEKTNDRAIDDAVTVLEDRLRTLAELPKSDFGVRLANKALRKDDGKLILSEEANEQESFHFLYRGMLGALKNPTSHSRFRNIPDIRAIQVVQFVDYLVGLLQEAKKR